MKNDLCRVTGTPTEDMWPGVSNLPNYRPHKLCYYKVLIFLVIDRPRKLCCYDLVFDIPPAPLPTRLLKYFAGSMAYGR